MNFQKTYVDYIIVGCGLAGIAFSETCLLHGKSIFVFDNMSQNSSTIAAGIYNPVILKRFSGLEHAQEQLNVMTKFYAALREKIEKQIDYKLAVLRKFSSIEEQNNWFTASDKESLATFLSLHINKEKINGIESPFDYGEVLQTGFIDTASLLYYYRKYLKGTNCYSNSKFQYDIIQIENDVIHYENLVAKQIVFAEGFGLHANTYFNNLPLDGTKGEIIIIKAMDLDLNAIVNSSLYVVPLGENLYKIGATYNWSDKTNQISSAGLQELVAKLNELVTCPYEIVNHFAGIRPTVKDRKPLLGTHHSYKNVHILNGLGTRGVMLGPWCAAKLYDSIENNIEIEKSMNISRFQY